MGTSYTTEPSVFFESDPNRSNLKVAGPIPWLEFEETDQTKPAGQYRFYASGDTLGLFRAATVDFGLHLSGMRYGGNQGNFAIATTVQADHKVIIAEENKPTSSMVGLGLFMAGGSITVPAGGIGANPYSNVYIQQSTLSAAGPETIANAASLYIDGAPDAGTNVTFTNRYGLWVLDDVLINGNLLIASGKAIKSNSATEIGISVTNAALTVGSLGSLVIPVRTAADNTDATDAEIGNVNGALYFNTNNTSLGVRTGVNTTVNVGLAGIIIQNRVPEVAEGNGIYHGFQFTGKLDPTGRRYVDETRCVQCGELFQPGESLSLYANAYMPKHDGQDVHAIFSHLHMENDPEFESHGERLEILEDETSMKSNKLIELEEQVKVLQREVAQLKGLA